MAARVRLPRSSAELLQLESDRTLLDRFIASQDSDAFAALVRRHGPMVLGICRRTVRDAHLAEDAFQASFLVLSKRPEAVRRGASLASWLFGVARRVSLAARRKQRKAEDVTALAKSAPPAERPAPDFDDLLRVLDDELARLPDELRAPLISCYLDERTQDEAARALGWSLSTLRRRLERGKELMRARLARRGIAFGASLFAAWLAPSASAAVPAPLAASALPGAAVSPAVIALAAAGLKRSLVPAAIAFSTLAIVLCGSIAMAAGYFDSPQPAPIASHPQPSPAVSTLRGRVVLPADRPVPATRFVESIEKDAEAIRANGPVRYEDVLVNPDDRGIRNVIVWLRPDSDDPRAAFPPDRMPPHPADTRVVEIGCCQFHPRAVAARTGDTLRFVNRSTIPHTVRHESSEADDFSVLLPANTGVDAPIPLAARPSAGSFACAIHPWMRGVVRVFDHPFFAVTDEHGEWQIANVPPGRYRIVYWHETAGYRGDRLGTPIMIEATASQSPVEFDVTLR